MQGLSRQGRQFYDVDNLPAALLCLDNVFEKTPVVERVTYPEVRTTLRLFSAYLKLLDAIKPRADLENVEACQQLFGWRCTADGFILPKNTVLRIGGPLGQAGANSSTVSKPTLRKALTRFLTDRITTRVTRLIDASLVVGFAPCIDQIMTGGCSRTNYECRYIHIKPNAATVQWYNDRIELLMNQFCSLRRLPRELWLSRERYRILNRFSPALKFVTGL